MHATSSTSLFLLAILILLKYRKSNHYSMEKANKHPYIEMDDRKWEELPLDCLVKIFEKLSLHELTLSVPFVCKAWCKASHDPSCFKVLNFRELDFLPWSEFIKTFSLQYSIIRFSFSGFMRLVVNRSCGSVIKLMFPWCFGATITDLAYASTRCPSLKLLTLPHYLLLEHDAQIPAFIGRWKELKELEMESKPSSFKDIISEISCNCREFKRLKFSGPIKKEDACALTSYLPEIKCLELDGSYLTKDVLMVIIKGCNKLEKLLVKGCLGFEADEEVLNMAGRIQTFEHKGSKLLDDRSYVTDGGEPRVGFPFW